MRRLTDTDGLSDVQRDILRTVRDFVDAEVLPVAAELDRTGTYPDKIVERLKELGVFGLTSSEQYGGLGESLLTYALVVEELSRGWMSISGIISTHFMVAYLIATHGTCRSSGCTARRSSTRSPRDHWSCSGSSSPRTCSAPTYRIRIRDGGSGYDVTAGDLRGQQRGRGHHAQPAAGP